MLNSDRKDFWHSVKKMRCADGGSYFNACKVHNVVDVFAVSFVLGIYVHYTRCACDLKACVMFQQYTPSPNVIEK